MAAYVVFTREHTRNEDEMKRNAELAIPTLEQIPAKPLAFYGALKVLEGRPLEGAVILEFLSVEAAQAWYDSAACPMALPHRMAGAEYGAFIVDGASAARVSA